MSLLPRSSKKSRHVSATRRVPARCRPMTRLRPQLDRLEDRLAPATALTWTGAVSQLGSDPANWAEGRTPILEAPFGSGRGVEYFDLFFPANVPNKVCDFSGIYVAANSITFSDAGYTIRGGALDLGKPGITSAALSGTNAIETRLTLDENEPNSEAIPFWIFGQNTLQVSASITDVGLFGTITAPRELRQIGTGTLILSGINDQDSTAIEEGTLIVAGTSALGNGPLKLVAGDTGLRPTLQSSGPITLANPIIAMTGPGDIRSSFDMLFAGTVEIQAGELDCRQHEQFDRVQQHHLRPGGNGENRSRLADLKRQQHLRGRDGNPRGHSLRCERWRDRSGPPEIERRHPAVGPPGGARRHAGQSSRGR